MTSAFIERRERLISLLVSLPMVGKAARALGRFAPLRRLAGRGGFAGSEAYWRQRYVTGGTSGAGSYGRLARFKADVLNAFVAEQGIASVVEFGCGDGAQLAMATYPSYVGIDVSPVALELCRKRFAADATKRFYLASEVPADLGPFDLALSLDVIYHLVEDAVFEEYMARLFRSARRFVAIYSSDGDLPATAPHVRHREFTRWIARHCPTWELLKFEKNPYGLDPARPDDTSFANMYFFQPKAGTDE
jgi:SAM-dependent methyltransferase